jgi:pilus assembly protein CpaE
VYGARGGLGATTLAVNLAFKLDGVTDHEVALFDLDLQRGDVAAFCDLNPVHSVANLATAPSEVDDAFLASTLVRHARGVSILAAPATIEEADLVTEHEVEVALRLLRARCAYTVIDTPRSLTASVVTALEQSDRILLLSDLSVPSVRAARRALELFGRLKIPLEHVDLVITEAVAGPVDVRKAVEVIGKEVFAVLPKDDAAGAAMNDGVPLNGRPTRLAVAVDTLARRLANVPAAPKGRGLLQRFLPKGARP